MAMRMFSRPGTGRPLRVAWTLEELGADYETVAVATEGPDAAAHRRRSPLGRVPALERELEGHLSGSRGATTLFDSTAIVLMLADLHPDAGLIAPLGSPERGATYAWCLTAMTELEPPAVQVLRDHDEASGDRFASAADALAAALSGREFLVGDRLGAADIVCGGVLLVSERAGLLGGDAGPPRLVEYLAALRSRPGFGRALERTESIFRPA